MMTMMIRMTKMTMMTMLHMMLMINQIRKNHLEEEVRAQALQNRKLLNKIQVAKTYLALMSGTKQTTLSVHIDGPE